VAGIHAWLRGRRLRVANRHGLQTPAEWTPTTSGVPQGSVLGPYLWLIFLDPILEATLRDSRAGFGTFHLRGMVAFADDIAMWASGSQLSTVAGGLSTWAARLVTSASELRPQNKAEWE
jgi:hypothetical protein